MFRSLALLLILSLPVKAQKPRIFNNQLAEHAFRESFKQNHNPELILSERRETLTGPDTGSRCTLLVVTRYPRSSKRFQTGPLYFLHHRIFDTSGRYQLTLPRETSESLSGSVVDIKTEPGPDAPDTLFARLRVPLRLLPVVIASAGGMTGADERAAFRIGRGDTLHWNADPMNEQGIYLSVHFNERVPGNEAFVGIRGWRGEVRNCIQVPDNGSVVLPRSLFRDVPRGAIVEVTLFRGNYAFLAARKTRPTPVPFIAQTSGTGYFYVR